MLQPSMLSTPSGSLVQNSTISFRSEIILLRINPLHGKDVIFALHDTIDNFSSKSHSLPYASYKRQDTQYGKSELVYSNISIIKSIFIDKIQRIIDH